MRAMSPAQEIVTSRRPRAGERRIAAWAAAPARHLRGVLLLASLLGPLCLAPGAALADWTFESALDEVDPRLREVTEAFAYGRHEEAGRLAEAVLASGEVDDAPELQFVLYRLLGTVAAQRQDAEATVAHFRAAGAAARLAGMDGEARGSLVQAAVVEASILGRIDEARQAFDALLAQSDPLGRAGIRRMMALWLDRDGDGDAARHQLRLALRELDEVPQEDARQERAEVDLELGRSLLETGEGREAVSCLLEARALGELLGDDLGGRVEMELGRAFARQHDLDRAEEAFRTALRQTTDEQKVGTALLELGRVEKARGDHEAARRMFDNAAKIARRGTFLPLLVETNLEMSRSMFAFDPEVAILSLEAMQSIAEEAGQLGSVSSASVDRDIALAVCEAGDVERAAALFDQAREKAADAPYARQQLLVGQARCERLQGNLPGARDALLAAAAILEQQRAEVAGGLAERRQFFAASLTVGEALVDVLVEQGDGEAALLAAETLKSRTLLDILTVAGDERSLALPPEIAERDAEIVSRIATLQRDALLATRFGAAQRKELDRLRDELADLRQQGAARVPGGAPLRSLAGGGDTDALRSALGPDEAALVYCLAGSDLLLFVVRRDGIDVHRIGDPEPLQRDVRRLRRYLAQPDPAFQRGLAVEPEGPADDATAAEVFQWLAGELFRTLWSPAAPSLEGVARVVVVPDGFLHYLPFEVLLDGDGRYVAERYVTSYAPSLSALQLLREAPARADRPASLFAVADPAFDAAGTDETETAADALRAQRGVRLVPLPGTRAEVDTIRALMDDAEVLTGRAATEPAVAAALAAGRQRYVHLATHGLVPDDLSWLAQPALVMSLAELDDAHDGLLDLGEISSLALDADVVVLSACQTAIGDEVRGEGLLGLTRAFLTAGAARVVASLWSVPDQATAELMSEFYRQLREHDAPTALANARRATMIDHPHPYHWAGFVITGR